MKRSNDLCASHRGGMREDVIVSEMSVKDVDLLLAKERSERGNALHERDGVLSLSNERMCERLASDFRFELVAADVGVVRIDSRFAQRFDLGICRCGSAGPTVR
jgi:hypothetical protein